MDHLLNLPDERRHVLFDEAGRSAAIRMISARKASRRETTDYEDNTP